jgi:hypothetical protein
MLVWLVANDGTYIDETSVETAPKVGENITTDKTYQIVSTPEPDENARKLNAQVLVVKEA